MAEKVAQDEIVVANRWRRRAYQMAQRALEEYRAALREDVLREAEALREEARRLGPHQAAVAQELVTRLAHRVVTLAPPRPRIEGDYERVDVGRSASESGRKE